MTRQIHSLSPTHPATTSRRARRVPLGLSRVGVTGVEKVVRIRDELFFARLDCFVDLSRGQKGAHMSRFEEVVNEAIGEVVLSESPFRAETLAQHIAELVRTRQGAERAEVTIAARYPEHKPAPVSGVARRRSTRCYGRAVALRAWHAADRGRVGDRHDRLPVRAGAGGRARARAPAPPTDSRSQQIERILAARAGRHPQPARSGDAARSAASRSASTEIDASALLQIAESSMSSEIYELMKRADEVEVVEKAHRRPRFVEDCVREMVAGVVRELSAAGRRELRLGAPGEPGDDPPAQRRRRASRPARGAARGGRLGHAGRASDEPRAVAGRAAGAWH